MLDLKNIPGESALIDASMKRQLQEVMGGLRRRVILKAVVDMEEEKSREMASFLVSFCGTSQLLELELYSPEEHDRGESGAPELNTAWLPVTGLYREEGYGRAAFHGIPGGKEMNSFVLAVCLLGGGAAAPDPVLMRRIESIQKPVNIKICVSLACHHCPKVVAACQRIAVFNPHVTAEMIDAALYKELQEQYKIERVPMMIINDSKVVMGSKDIEEITELLCQ